MQRTESEIVAVGTYARSLLESDTFNALHKEYTDAMLTAIVSSEPHETKAREFEYAKTRAMIGFVNHLLDLAVSAENIIQKNSQPVADAEASIDDEE